MTTNRRQKRRCGVAWLAVLALLINALVPASLAVASALHSAEAMSGWCGTSPDGHQPTKGAAPVICNHCILCAAASGLAPPGATAAVAPAPTAILIAGGVTPATLPRLSAYRPAQPRGPPVAARM